MALAVRTIPLQDVRMSFHQPCIGQPPKSPFFDRQHQKSPGIVVFRAQS